MNMDDVIDSVKSSEISVDEFDKKCAPSGKFSNNSCIPLNILVNMASAFNKSHGNETIKLYKNFETLNPTKYKRYLLKEFKNKLGDTCKTQLCWTKQGFIDDMHNSAKEELLKYTFRPEGPEGKFEWLNTININEVMKQYEKKYKDFLFMGAVPIDFDDLPVLGIRNINYKALLSQGKSKLGFVFNLDRHDQDGSHWVALFSDLSKCHIYFFDSYGLPPKEEIRTLMRRIYRFCELSNGKKVISDYNKMRHQYDNSECGVYSINFIIRMLDGDKFEKICKDKTPDDVINKFRNEYFVNVNI